MFWSRLTFNDFPPSVRLTGTAGDTGATWPAGFAAVDKTVDVGEGEEGMVEVDDVCAGFALANSGGLSISGRHLGQTNP